MCTNYPEYRLIGRCFSCGVVNVDVQILGAEARSRVPAEYITQQPTSANPPTLFLLLAQMADEITTASPDAKGSGRLHDQELFLKAGESSHPAI